MKVTTRVKKRQFSLLEIIIAISIVALIASIAVPSLLRSADEANVDVCKTEIRSIKQAITMYKVRKNKYPEALSSLSMDDLDKDPWGNEYQYEVTPDGFKIMSFGSDGQSGGEGVNADIIVSQSNKANNE